MLKVEYVYPCQHSDKPKEDIHDNLEVICSKLPLYLQLLYLAIGWWEELLKKNT